MTAPKVSPVVLAVTYVGWLTALSVVALVPLDVFSALAGDDPGPLGVLWSISYWCAGRWITRAQSLTVADAQQKKRVPACHKKLGPPPPPLPPGPCRTGTILSLKKKKHPALRTRSRRSTQVLTWAVIPVLQGYAISGAFSILGRLRSSLMRLWVFYLIIGALAAAGVVAALAAGKLTLATLPALIFTLSNTYGAVAGRGVGPGQDAAAWCIPKVAELDRF